MTVLLLLCELVQHYRSAASTISVVV